MLLYTINKIPMVLEIIISKFSCIFKWCPEILLLNLKLTGLLIAIVKTRDVLKTACEIGIAFKKRVYKGEKVMEVMMKSHVFSMTLWAFLLGTPFIWKHLHWCFQNRSCFNCSYNTKQGSTWHGPMAHPIVFRYLSYSTTLAEHAGLGHVLQAYVQLDYKSQSKLW